MRVRVAGTVLKPIHRTEFHVFTGKACIMRVYARTMQGLPPACSILRAYDDIPGGPQHLPGRHALCSPPAWRATRVGTVPPANKHLHLTGGTQEVDARLCALQCDHNVRSRHACLYEVWSGCGAC
jgi:hypothetical protein